MEYTLHVSHNCGITYYPTDTSADLDELVKKGDEEYKGLRWHIEDEVGEQHSICKIHADILITMMKINKAKGE